MNIKYDSNTLNLNGSETKILIAASNASSVKNIISLLNQYEELKVVDTAFNGEDCLKKLLNNKVDVLVTEFKLPKLSGLKIAERLSLEKPEIAVIILAEQNNLGFFRSAMVAGTSDFLTIPVLSNELAKSIKRASFLRKERQKRRDHNLFKAMNKSIKTSKVSNGKVITFLSGKGGTGKSFTSSNMAVSLAEIYPNLRFSLVDLDIQFGDIDIIFDIKAKNTYLDLIRLTEELSPEITRNIGRKYKNYGNLEIFTSPCSLEKEELINSNFIIKYLESLKNLYDFTLINTGPHITEVHIDLIEASDIVILVCNGEIPSLRASSELKKVYKKLGLSTENILLLINRYNFQTSIKIKKIKENLNLKLIGLIPDEPNLVCNNINTGKIITSEINTTLHTFITKACKKLFRASYSLENYKTKVKKPSEDVMKCLF